MTYNGYRDEIAHLGGIKREQELLYRIPPP